VSYTAILASVTTDAIDQYRAGPSSAALAASRVEQCPHDLTNVDLQPLGAVLAESIDIGQPLRNDGWHPLRTPVVADPETVMARSMKLEEAWREAKPELGGMMGDVLGPDIDRIRALYAHATSRGEAVVSFLSAPDDADKAARTLLPDLQVGQIS
jgi:hypothetical protein